MLLLLHRDNNVMILRVEYLTFFGVLKIERQKSRIVLCSKLIPHLFRLGNSIIPLSIITMLFMSYYNWFVALFYAV